MTFIPPISSRARGKALANYKQNLSVTERQKEISIGLMLGDASLQTQTNKKTYRLKYQLMKRNKEYANHLVEEFRPWILSDPHEIKRVNANGNTVESLGFQTLSDEKWNYLADIFLKQENQKFRKSFDPSLVINNLTAVSLAYWFMDDGGKMDYGPNQGKGLVYNTQGFEKKEVEGLVLGLREKFELDCWVKLNKGKRVIAISGKSFEIFQEIVEPHIIPEMKYKLPTARKK